MENKNNLEVEEQELSGNETLCFLTTGRPLNSHVVFCLSVSGVSKWPKPAAGSARGDLQGKGKIVA